MPSARRRTLIVELALSVVLTLLIAGCTAAAVKRTAPDAPETAAVARAVDAARRDGIPVRDNWVQLWTPVQAGAEISACVTDQSEGALFYTVARRLDGLPAGVVGIDGTNGKAFAITENDEKVVVDRCLAHTPVDVRILWVPAADRDALYSYDLTVLRHCLLAHGQRVGLLPDRAEFVSLMRAGTPWNAYDRVRVATRSAWYELIDACPAFPATIARDTAVRQATVTTP